MPVKTKNQQTNKPHRRGLGARGRPGAGRPPKLRRCLYCDAKPMPTRVWRAHLKEEHDTSWVKLPRNAGVVK